jgi:hypothetical protein
MQTTLENRRKATTKSPKNAFKRNNRVEEGGASKLRIKKEHESIKIWAQKMMKERAAPSTLPTLVQVGRQNVKVPHMSSSQDR